MIEAGGNPERGMAFIVKYLYRFISQPDLPLEVVDGALSNVIPWRNFSQVSIWNRESPLCGCQYCETKTNDRFQHNQASLEEQG